jgi:hypothetical protein
MQRKHEQSGSAGSDPLTRAEELLIEFIARLGEPGEVTFQALCEAHPKYARELERLYTAWCTFQRALAGQFAPRPPVSRADRPSDAD